MFLSIRNLVVHYGRVQAVNNVSMEISQGTVAGLLGANGSGKSTILKTICGLKTASSGEVWFEGKRIDGMPTSKILRLGIGMVPEGRRLFPRMTVTENLMIGAYTRDSKTAIMRDIEEVLENFPVLKRKTGNAAGTLSGGEQEMLAIGRSLMSRPKALLMDEPSQGLAPLIIREVEDIIRGLHERGMTIILVEHNVRMALGLCHKIFMLETGELIFEGSPDALSQDEYVKKIYLGG